MSCNPSAHASPAIRLRGVSKQYHLFQRPQDRLKQALFGRRRNYGRVLDVLSSISFDVAHGETIGIIGRNGAGKSTLLQIIAGTLAPTEGRVEVNGRIAPLIELGAGFNPEFTGRENVFLNGALLGMSDAEIERKFDKIAAFADIGSFIDLPVKTYSTGMYARLAFAVAIHVDPEILIVDEILAVGDASFQHKCIRRFYELRDGGCTILLVAHNSYMVRSMCSRAIYLKDGRIAAMGPADEVTAAYEADMGASATDGDAEADTRPSSIRSDIPNIEQYFRITAVGLLGEDGTEVQSIRHGETLRLRMCFESTVPNPPKHISFVFNLYRADGTYVCGSTSLMDGHLPYRGARSGEVVVTFPRLALLQGQYVWRTAINDDGGMLVLAEAKGVCPFQITDDFRSVGLIHLEREWQVRLEADPQRLTPLPS